MATLGTTWERESLGGGKYRSVLHNAPIAYALPGGQLRRIEGPWESTGDANLTLGKSQLLDVRVRPRLAGNSPLVHFGHGGSHVRFTPLDTANVDGAADLTARSIRFRSAWAGGTDLELIDGGHFLRKNIHLAAGSPRSFSFRVDESSGMDEKTLAAPTWRIPRPYLYHPTKFAINVPLDWIITRKSGKLILTVALPAGDWDGWILDPSPLVSQPDETAGKDNAIGSDQGNNGTSDQLYTGSYLGQHYEHLIQPDFSSIPSTATVTSAVMRLVVRIACLAASRTIYWRAILASWSESQSTWYKRTTSPDVSWTTAGCRSDGNDRQAATMGSATIASTDTPGTTYDDITLDTAVVQDWVDGSLANNGMVGQDSEDSAGNTSSHYYSSAASTAGNRPKWTVAYTDSLTITPDPATCPAVAPSPTVRVRVNATPATCPAVAPAPQIRLAMTPTPAACPAAVPAPQIRLVVAPSVCAVATVAPATGLVLSMTPSPVTAPAAVPSPQVRLSLSPSPAQAVAIAPTANLRITLAPSPAICAAAVAAPFLRICLTPSPATVACVCPDPTLVFASGVICAALRLLLEED